MSDLTDRLHKNCPHDWVGCLCDETADTITEQAAEIERLRDALENMMGAFNTPIARRKMPGAFAYKARDSARKALNKEPTS